MWLSLFLFFIHLNPNACPASPPQDQLPSLVVQVVDPNWLPTPGAKVIVKPLDRNTQLEPGHAETDKDGFASFILPRDAEYAIEVELYGFKRERVRPVHLFKARGSSDTAYVQVRLRLSGRGTTVY